MNRRIVNEQLATDAGDVYAENIKLKGRFSHVNACPNHQRYLTYWFGKEAELIPGKSVLDLGCYVGGSMKRFSAHRPSKLVGIDISPNAVSEAKTLGFEAHVMDAHQMSFPDESFDLIIGQAVLHHLDFFVAIKEARRVLKPGGAGLFIEPLRDNPAAKLFRVLTPRARTRDEMPLSRRQIQEANKLFASHEHRFFGFFSTGLALVTSLLWRRNANNAVLRAADRLDLAVADSPLKYWMRIVVLIWRK